MALAEFSRDHRTIDAISICGNGEPTLYPALAEVIVNMKQIRDRYQPHARVAILSNSSTVGDPVVRAALDLLDLKIMKFDAGSEEMFRQLNHPAAPVYMGEIVAGLKQLENIFLQSCFVQGRVINADPDSVAMWIDKVREIHPLGVQLYTLDREPADKRIETVSLTNHSPLDRLRSTLAGGPASGSVLTPAGRLKSYRVGLLWRVGAKDSEPNHAILCSSTAPA
jgi:wyosine [tRNA(Phe)-imidazoG37] synthetase (radical SAM superfamily)